MNDQTATAEDERVTAVPPPSPGPLPSWAILELFGHRSLAGYVSEALVAGVAFVRIDVPRRDGSSVTQLYNPKSVYSLTPTTEEAARAVAARNEPSPPILLQLSGGSSAGRYDAEADDHLHDCDDDADDDSDDEEF